ncbi:response regulator [Candidatus Margulisiibacteriota bacterium]
MLRKKILLIEDENDIVELLTFTLSKEGAQICAITNGEEALDKAKTFEPDVILLDLILPEVDGLEICRQLKMNPQTQNIPIIMLTAKTDDSDIITGLEVGADDYITKPFNPKVLIARIRTVLRRISKQSSVREDKVIRVKNMVIDPIKREVSIDHKQVDLTFSEFQTLYFLANQPGWVFSRYQIVEAIHGNDYVVTDRTIDVLIVSLRKKLDDYAKYLETVRGVGYKFKEVVA